MAKGFKKGKEKTGGRRKGIKNKKTRELVETIEHVLHLIENNTLEKDIMAMTPTARMILWQNLQEYIRPKLARTDMNITADERIVEIQVIGKSVPPSDGGQVSSAD